MKKDSELPIRMQRELYAGLPEVRRAQDKPTAQVLRQFTREYVEGSESLQGGVVATNQSRERGRCMSIETKFDIALVASLALREKQIQQNYRPIIAVHKWFARRPGTLFRLN